MALDVSVVDSRGNPCRMDVGPNFFVFSESDFLSLFQETAPS